MRLLISYTRFIMLSLLRMKSYMVFVATSEEMMHASKCESDRLARASFWNKLNKPKNK